MKISIEISPEELKIMNQTKDEKIMLLEVI